MKNKTRKICFRAWNKKLKRMGKSSTLQEIVEYTASKPDTAIHFQEIILMQFTGLLDKNGKEIYESDIVRTIVDSEYGKNNLDDEVIFGGGAFYPICTQPSETWEVIGNIYENSELLQKP